MTSIPLLTELKLHKKSALLELHFDDGAHFELSAEFLRVHSPSADVRGHTPDQAVLQTGKKGVTITSLRPVGNYGVTPVFSDGHDSGIFTWDYLYHLGSQRDTLWQDYLDQLTRAGSQR